jgi:hypothetical protein
VQAIFNVVLALMQSLTLWSTLQRSLQCKRQTPLHKLLSWHRCASPSPVSCPVSLVIYNNSLRPCQASARSTCDIMVPARRRSYFSRAVQDRHRRLGLSCRLDRIASECVKRLERSGVFPPLSTIPPLGEPCGLSSRRGGTVLSYIAGRAGPNLPP